jgi:hypothetical protein
MDLGAGTSLIIYLQPWSESMALAPLISWISPHSPKTQVFEFIQNRKENHWIWEKPLLGTCSLCWSDPCVQVLFNLQYYSARIKVGKKEVDFGRKSCFLETSYQTMSSRTEQCPTWPRKGPTLSFELQKPPIGQCPTETFNPTFIHGFSHILLIGCPIDPILFRMHS